MHEQVVLRCRPPARTASVSTVRKQTVVARGRCQRWRRRGQCHCPTSAAVNLTSRTMQTTTAVVRTQRPRMAWLLLSCAWLCQSIRRGASDIPRRCRRRLCLAPTVVVSVQHRSSICFAARVTGAFGRGVHNGHSVAWPSSHQLLMLVTSHRILSGSRVVLLRCGYLR